MDRLNFFFDQTVSTPDMSQLQTNIEKADQNLAKDILGPGIISGLEVVPNSPADLNVRILHGGAYDAYGRRIEVAGDISKDCSLLIPASENTERWLTIVAKFARNDYDPHQDGEGNTVLYKSDEYYEIAILAGDEAEIGSATKPAPAVGDIILADVKVTHGQVSIIQDDIDLSRRMLSRTESVSDVMIGNRTIDPELEGGSNTGKLTQLLSWMARQIKAITRKQNWYDELGTFVAPEAEHSQTADVAHNVIPAIASLVLSNWTTRSGGLSGGHRKICWSPELGIFVAVGGLGRLHTSPDGIVWTSRTHPLGTQSLNGVCWSPEEGIFVVVASAGSNTVMTSSDGINWYAQTTPANHSWWDVCYSPQLGLFVTVAFSGTPNQVMYSSNGTNWTLGTLPSSNSWSSVIWCAELGIFVASKGSVVATSSDGINWDIGNVQTGFSVLNPCWSAELGIFIGASTGSEGHLVYSFDGKNWSGMNTNIPAAWSHCSWSPELRQFVCMSTNSLNKIISSSDGFHWKLRHRGTVPGNGTWSHSCWSPERGIFVAVAEAGGEFDEYVMTSLPYVI